MNQIDEDRDPILRAIADVRHRAACNFAPEFSGQRGCDYDRGVLDCYEAVKAVIASTIEARSDATPKSGAAEGESVPGRPETISVKEAKERQ